MKTFRPTLQSPLSFLKMKMCFWLLLAFACLPQLSAASHHRVRYDEASIAYNGRGCTEDWCGEKWRSNRILYYNLTVKTEIVYVNKTLVITSNDCEGAQSSIDCEQTEKTVQVQQEKARVDVVSRISDEPIEVRDTEELRHSYLLSDNVELNNENGAPQLKSDHYPANLTKIWQLKIPKGCKMNVHFFNFSIEKSPNCEHDYFSMQTSKDPEDVLVFCDQLEWIAVKSRRRVQFTLHSDYALNRGQVAAHVCLSKLATETGECDCPEEPASRRRRSAPSESALENSRTPVGEKGSLASQRIAALQRLQNSKNQNSILVQALKSIPRNH